MEYIYAQPLHSGRIWPSSIFKWSLTGLNSEFSFSKTSCLTKSEEPLLPNYLPIPGGRIIGFIHFPSLLVLSEMQTISSSIRTHVIYIYIESLIWFNLGLNPGFSDYDRTLYPLSQWVGMHIYIYIYIYRPSGRMIHKILIGFKIQMNLLIPARRQT